MKSKIRLSCFGANSLFDLELCFKKIHKVGKTYHTYIVHLFIIDYLLIYGSSLFINVSRSTVSTCLFLHSFLSLAMMPNSINQSKQVDGQFKHSLKQLIDKSINLDLSDSCPIHDLSVLLQISLSKIMSYHYQHILSTEGRQRWL